MPAATGCSFIKIIHYPLELQIPPVESWGLFLLLISHYPSGIDWIAFARLCLGHLGAGLAVVTAGGRWELSESLWDPKLRKILGPHPKLWVLHLLLTCSWAEIEMGKEGCSPPLPPSSSTYSSPDGRKRRQSPHWGQGSEP